MKGQGQPAAAPSALRRRESSQRDSNLCFGFEGPRPTIARMERVADLAKLYRQQAEGFARFAEWEASHRPTMAPEAAVAAMGAIYELLPAASRRRPIDTAGVRRMHEALRHLR